MADQDGLVSLRPQGFRPGGASTNPFAKLGKGAGLGIRNLGGTAILAAIADDTPKKPRGEVVKYSADFLLKFMERYTKCPIDVQQSQLEIVISDEQEQVQAKQILQRVAEDATDERDWRSRTVVADAAAERPLGAADTEGQWQSTAQPQQQSEPRQQQAAASAASTATQWQSTAQPAQQQQQQQKQQPASQPRVQPAQTPSAESQKIQKASDIGREAYKPGASVSQEQRALRQIKGILNKLTPEKFERLLNQLLEVITTAAVLKSSISMVFENAVAQPTFCAMYADLCLQLSKELPSFPPQDGDDGRPMSFKRVLLNTCQDEFEGAAAMREELEQITDPQQHAVAERGVKMRTLGTVRLIAELYKKEVVKESIVLVCVRELLDSKNAKVSPPEENLEAACEMITISGKMLAASENKKTRDQLDGFMARLERLQTAKDLPVRIRFLIKDVLEMRKNKWVPRRETFTAKKLDEVHAEAEAELGMVSSRVLADLPALPVQARGAAAEDFSLLPPLRGGGEDGWEFVGKKSDKVFTNKGSALTGTYKPPPPLERRAAPVAAPAPALVAPKPKAAEPKAPAKVSATLSADDVEAKSKSLFREYASVGDVSEAAICVRELGDTPHLHVLVRTGLSEVMDALKERDASVMSELMVKLHGQGLLSAEVIAKGLGEHTEQLEDLSVDVPKAPALLGRFFGSAAAAGAANLATLPELLGPTETAETRRKFAAAAFMAFKEAQGQDGLAKAAGEAGLKVGELLGKQEFDPEDLPSVEEWVKAEGLTGAVPL